MNFWDYDAWGLLNILTALMLALLLANIIKRRVGFLRKSLIPTSVLGGLLILIPSLIYEKINGTSVFDLEFFGGNGASALEIITYHCLALGFIAITFKPSKAAFSMKRNIEIFNTGITTVATYLLQATLGLAITIIATLFVKDFFPASGCLLPFGYGQGTGQALNYGNMFETEYGFEGGKSFGLTIAALGFLSASIGGVIHLNIMKRKGKITEKNDEGEEKSLLLTEIQSSDEIPMNGGIDKLTFQFVFILCVYACVNITMLVLSKFIPGLRNLVYGFNFLLGVLFTTLFKASNVFLRKKKIIKRQYISPFLMTRISGFFFDLMIIAGIAAIRINVLKKYWIVVIVLGLVGAFSTYYYNKFVARVLFPRYSEEQFLAMYGMLTGTASTGMILLREIDPEFETPAADNLVYQNLPAIVFGFPMMFLAAFAPAEPVLTTVIVFVSFIVLNILLFRRKIISFFRKKKK